MRIVVTGGRDHQDPVLIWDVLDELNPEYVHVGDCPTGVDLYVREWCDDNKKITYKIFTANWDKFGRKAGPMRNGFMLDDAGPKAVVVAFKGGRGTADCVRQAKGKGMLVLKVEDYDDV